VSQLLSSEFYQTPRRLVLIRVIRVIRGFNILSFQLQNHSTSLMPTRKVGLHQCVHSFFSIRDNPFSPFHPCSTSTHDHCVNGLTQNSSCQTRSTRVTVRSSLMFAVE
jgi:hypothetical protein